jgi:elongation factor P
MATVQATRLKRGMLIKVQNDLFRVLDLQHFTPGNKRGFVQAKMRNIYRDGDSFHFMDTENYEQLHIDAEVLGDNANYMVPESMITVELHDEKPVGIELPVTVDLKVVDTVPGINRATASAQVKPATLETGLVVQVPPFVSVGDTLRISTETGEYLKKV